jgi:hypothetical protein
MLQSDDPRDKLLAAANYGRPIPGNEYPRSYLRACSEWFGKLSPRNREVAHSAAMAYGLGDDDEAERIATLLPRAPRCPVFSERL